jgi:hypothetical protein
MGNILQWEFNDKVQKYNSFNINGFKFTLALKRSKLRGSIQKFPDWPPGVITVNGTALCHEVQL